MSSTESMNASATSAFTKLRSSCRSCHKSHKKCDGKNNDAPCSRCQKRNENCIWDEQRKRGPKRKRGNDDDSLYDDDEEIMNREERRKRHANEINAEMTNNDQEMAPKNRGSAPNQTSTTQGGSVHTQHLSNHNISPNQSSSQHSLNKSHHIPNSNLNIQNFPHKPEGYIANESLEPTVIENVSTSQSSKDDHIIRINILLGGTGSVGSIKIPEIVHKLTTYQQSVQDNRGQIWTFKFGVTVILTNAAQRFVTKEQINEYIMKHSNREGGDARDARVNRDNKEGWGNEKESSSPNENRDKDARNGKEQTQESFIHVMDDEEEWRRWSQIGDEVAHIELRKKFDMLIIAPLSANTLAKIANGMCDNLLTCVFRAWDNQEKPVLVFPAMNTHMWNNHFTTKHLDILHGELRVNIGNPISKRLACGDIGMGGMQPPDEIVHQASQVALKQIVHKKIMQLNGSILTSDCIACQKSHPIVTVHDTHPVGVHDIPNPSLTHPPMHTSTRTSPSTMGSTIPMSQSSNFPPIPSPIPPSQTLSTPLNVQAISPTSLGSNMNSMIPSAPHNQNTPTVPNRLSNAPLHLHSSSLPPIHAYTNIGQNQNSFDASYSNVGQHPGHGTYPLPMHQYHSSYYGPNPPPTQTTNHIQNHIQNHSSTHTSSHTNNPRNVRLSIPPPTS